MSTQFVIRHSSFVIPARRASWVAHRRPPPRHLRTILLRESPSSSEFEVFMLRRPADARFAPNNHSFPGGMLDAEDTAAAARFTTPAPGMTADDHHARMGGDGLFASPDPATSTALLYCAARETFEETGVLVARDEAGAYATLADEAYSATSRDDVLAGTLPFDNVLSASGLTISLGDLIYFSHWITPETSPPALRYPLLPHHPAPRPGRHPLARGDGGRRMADATRRAERYEARRMPMFPVQVQHLMRFARFARSPNS
ncbi:MAG: hypothetical protein U0232_17165 [Thermomicrobiales bacterium]